MGIDKLNILLCDNHLEKCEEGLFKTKHPEEEPCLLCIIQEQQKKIDEFVSIVHEAYMSDGNSSVEIVYDKIQGLLK